MFNYDISEEVEFYSEISYASNVATQILAPVPAVGFFVINLDNPVLTPATQQLFANGLFPVGPGMGGMVFRRRMLELGGRTIESDRE